MESGVIFKIKKYALHDGPGIRTTVFLKGCPLSCWWCHNPEGQAPEPQVLKTLDHKSYNKETAGSWMTVRELIREIEKDVVFYDQSGGGVTFSGGEPLSQPEFLVNLLKDCRLHEIHTAIDTCGLANPETFKQAIDWADLVLFDLKVMDEAAHRQYTGASNQLILKNLRAAAESKTPLRIRIPIIPGITDATQNLAAAARFLKTLNGIKHIDILPFHKIGAKKYQRLEMADPMAGIQPPNQEHLQQIKADLELAGFKVSIGG